MFAICFCTLFSPTFIPSKYLFMNIWAACVIRRFILFDRERCVCLRDVFLYTQPRKTQPSVTRVGVENLAKLGSTNLIYETDMTGKFQERRFIKSFLPVRDPPALQFFNYICENILVADFHLFKRWKNLIRWKSLENLLISHNFLNRSFNIGWKSRGHLLIFECYHSFNGKMKCEQFIQICPPSNVGRVKTGMFC